MNGSILTTNVLMNVCCLLALVGQGAGTAIAVDPPVGEIGALLDSDAGRMSFQGLFTNNGGQALPGNSVSLEFRIYEIGGIASIGSIPAANYPMAEGIVHAQLPVSPDWFDGTGRELGVSVNGGAEMSPRIPLTATPYAFRVHRVASQELDDDIWLGDTDTAGSLFLFDGTHGEPSITLDGVDSLLTMFNTTGLPSVQLYGPSGVVRSRTSVEVRTNLPDGSKRAWMNKAAAGGEFQTWDNANHLTTWIGTKSQGGGGVQTNNPVGGFGQFQTTTGATGVLCDGSYMNNAGAVLVQKAVQGGSVAMVEIIGDDGDSASAINMYESGQTRIRLDARGSGGGGGINMFNSNKAETVHIDADSDDAAEMFLADRDANPTLGMDGDDGNGSRIALGVRTTETLRMDANDGDEMGRITFFGQGDTRYPEGAAPVMILEGSDGNGSHIAMFDNGVDTLRMFANDGDGGGRISVRSSADSTNVRVDGCGGDDLGTCGGGILVFDGSGNATVEIDGDEIGEGAQIRVGNGNGTSGGIRLYRNGQGDSTIHLNGHTGNARFGLDGQESGEVLLYSDAGGGAIIHLNGQTGNARLGTSGVDSGELFLYSASGGGASIWLNGDTGNTRTKTLTITGGADLAEPFEVNANGTSIEPGMLVSIDPKNPGQLKLCETPYDRTVAGVISGAGGVNPGMIMGQDGSIAHGRYPVALTGRVYVYADASAQPIEVGDLLTTSSTLGHAAKVVDHNRAQGAVIGKAMTPLTEGRGLVLVLVSLQ